MSWILFWIIIAIAFIIFVVKEWGSNIKKFITSHRQTTRSIPVSVGTNPPPAGHNTHPRVQTKSPWLKLMTSVLAIILIALFLVFVVWALTAMWRGIVSFFEPSPRYETVVVFDRTVKVNLDSVWSDANTLYLDLSKGEKCTFKEATVPFCIQNTLGEMVCGEPGTDPNLPSGPGNQVLWFISKNSPAGTIKVDVYKRVRQRVN
jgi:hypothetical protein